MILGELVSLRSSRGIELNGICYRRPGNGATIIHIHGSFGNFYANPVIPSMAEIYMGAGINLLSINMSCHDGLAEGDRGGVFEYLGGSRTGFAECLYDIGVPGSFCTSEDETNWNERSYLWHEGRSTQRSRL
jgi:hypothetical protein